MRTQVLSLLLPWLVAACGGPAATQARDYGEAGLPKDGALSVSLRMLLISGSEERSVAENETLHTGDQVYFLVRTNQPAYLYVVLFGTNGVMSTLSPSSPANEQMVAANCPLRVPAKGTFYLQSPAGTEDLRVVASAVPLAAADPRLCQQLGLPCQPPPPAPASPPQCESASARALFSAVKVATATARGVASLRVTLRHEP